MDGELRRAMRRRSALLLGIFAIVACAGCASGMAPAASDGAGLAAPGGLDPARVCERDGGWYDHAAGVCSHGGP